MAFKKETLAKIAELLKVPVADLEKAATEKDEVDVTIPDGLNVFTETELTTLKANEYKNGKGAGVEMAVKEAREKHGLEFTGKTIDGLLDAHSKKVLADAKVEPEKKVTELTAQINTLKKTVSDMEQAQAQKAAEVKKVKTDFEALKLFPDHETFTREDMLTLARGAGYDFDLTDEGGLVVKKGGEVLKNKLGEAEDPKAIVGQFLEAKKLVSAESGGAGGRGGSDKKPAGAEPKTLSEAKAKFEAEGKSLMGEEFAKYIEEKTVSDKTFDPTK